MSTLYYSRDFSVQYGEYWLKKRLKGGSSFSPFSSPFYLYMVRGQTVATPRLTDASTAPGWQI
jgi:hypothetical protein